MNENDIKLEVFQDEDVAIFTQWLDKDYIYKWFCCDGKDDAQARIDGLEGRKAWIDEVTTRKENPHRNQFIAMTNHGDVKIGFGICLDLTGEPEYTKEQYPDLYGNIKPGEAFEIGYCIGEEAYLGRGVGKIIIKKLEAAARDLGAALLLSDPSEDNIPSVKVLLANGFEKHKDTDYRKKLK